MSNRSTSKTSHPAVMNQLRPKSKLRLRRNKALARERRAERQAANDAVYSKALEAIAA